jgi:hypothetical protein
MGSIFLIKVISVTVGRIISVVSVALDVRLVLIRGNNRFEADERDGKSLIK